MARIRIQPLLGVLMLGVAMMNPQHGGGSSPRLSLESPSTRHFILSLDGVGYALVDELARQGHFAFFHRPARLIAPFPTLTNPAFIEILKPLGAPPSPGYEDYYYDPTANAMRGGFWHRFRRRTFIEGTFRELFDYHPSGLTMTLEYAMPPLSAWLDAQLSLQKAVGRFKRSADDLFIAYVSATDALAHLGGEGLLRRFLVTLDRKLEQLFIESEGRIHITLFSDHGNLFARYRRAELQEALRADGFRLGNRLEDERSVVQPRYGLVGCAIFYVVEAQEPRVAEVLAIAPGVDVVAYQRNGMVYVVGPRGRARIERRGDRYRYLTFAGDPLLLKPILDQLRAEGRMDDEGFVADADLFAATHAHSYPDALRRLWEGLTSYVRHPASVLVSLEDGYYDGSDIFDLLAVLRATHGNLRRAQTEGFVLTTVKPLPEAIRAADLWSALGLPLDGAAPRQDARP
ncbi:MAG: hypothetical protein N0A16_12955 [Blastocatellia bacterium]|nr:hypothetical protein [Blastocatellia bacterium]